jgi:hypothetical protein
MTKSFDSLDDVFNITKEVVDISTVNENIDANAEVSQEKIKINTSNISDIEKDYEYTRGNLYSIIEKGQEAINGILELAQESEQPRAYEVAGQLIKNVADATEKLLDLQKKLKDIEGSSRSSGPTNVTNALFVGSTAELSKLLKNKLNTPEK